MGSRHASFSHKKHLGPSCHRFLFTTGCSSFLFCTCQALRRFFIPFREGISKQEFPRLIQSQDMKRRKKETYFLLFSTPYCEEMLVVLSIVPTKAAFCLMTNEQRNCFPETSKMWVTRSFTLMSVFTPSLLLLHLRVKPLMSIRVHWPPDFGSRIFSVKE